MGSKKNNKKKPEPKPKKVDPYIFTDKERAVIEYLVEEKNTAAKEAFRAEMKMNGFLNTVAREHNLQVMTPKGPVPTLPFFDDVKMTGMYATQKEAIEAGKKK